MKHNHTALYKTHSEVAYSGHHNKKKRRCRIQIRQFATQNPEFRTQSCCWQPNMCVPLYRPHPCCNLTHTGLNQNITSQNAKKSANNYFSGAIFGGGGSNLWPAKEDHPSKRTLHTLCSNGLRCWGLLCGMDGAYCHLRSRLELCMHCGLLLGRGLSKGKSKLHLSSLSPSDFKEAFAQCMPGAILWASVLDFKPRSTSGRGLDYDFSDTHRLGRDARTTPDHICCPSCVDMATGVCCPEGSCRRWGVCDVPFYGQARPLVVWSSHGHAPPPLHHRLLPNTQNQQAPV